MATILYRKLDANGDPLWGQSQANFLADNDAVAQAILTRLKLLAGEWWENVNDGTPIFQSMLGVSGAGQQPDAVSLILQQRILGTPYVLSISNLATSWNGTTRAFAFSCRVLSQFGTILVSLQPSGLTAANLNQ